MTKIEFEKLNIHSAPNKRSELENLWVSFQPYLLSKGYRLRARYQPDWIPSWKTGDSTLLHEDSLDCKPLWVLDATRIKDEQQVKIKIVIPSPNGEALHEYALLQRFSLPPLKDDPSNHVVPLLDSFPIPAIDSGYFIVTPLLGEYNHPSFYNLAEIHDFLQQLFEGIMFMHKNDVAHCDIAGPNVMMDSRPLYDEPFHPHYYLLCLDVTREIVPKYTRTQKKSRYYLINLGHAKWFQEPGTPRIAQGIVAREPAPEQSPGVSWDPFRVDIYQLGALIGGGLMRDFDLSFLAPLVEQMTQPNPIDRPNLETAQASLNTAFLGLSGWRYRRPIVTKKASFQAQFQAFLIGLSTEFKGILQHILQRILQILRLK